MTEKRPRRPFTVVEQRGELRGEGRRPGQLGLLRKTATKRMLRHEAWFFARALARGLGAAGLTPRAITPETPSQEQRRLIYFPPDKGWIAGEWFEGRWVDAITLEHELSSTRSACLW